MNMENFVIMCKHSKNGINYYIKLKGNIFMLGFISFQHFNQQKKEIGKEIFKENEEYNFVNFIYALSQYRQLKITKGLDYSKVIQDIRNTLIGENNVR
ncbi:MAG: hypothetical protein QXP59_07755 [Saccharolobus sp.]